MTNETLLPPHIGCFICDPSVPTSMGIRWYGQPDGKSVRGTVTLGITHQGPPNHAHGGSSAAILDDIMGTCAWYAGYMSMTGKMTVTYHRPVPLNVALTIAARVVDQQGRKIFISAEIKMPNGDILVGSEGLFIEIPEMFQAGITEENMGEYLGQIVAGKRMRGEVG
ncbi:MAG TPA: PaaI family thioesterase [Anaerolineae bacterium]|nr:PaaI family thioesterase [Anaerolineae bacterium]